MRIRTAIFGVLSVSIIFVQAYRSAQILADLLLRDLVDELDIRYPNTDTGLALPPLSTGEFLDARPLRHLDGFLGDARLRRRLLDYGDYLSTRGDSIEAAQSKSTQKSASVPRGPITLNINAVGTRQVHWIHHISVTPERTIGDVKKEIKKSGYDGPLIAIYQEGGQALDSTATVGKLGLQDGAQLATYPFILLRIKFTENDTPTTYTVCVLEEGWQGVTIKAVKEALSRFHSKDYVSLSRHGTTLSDSVLVTEKDKDTLFGTTILPQVTFIP